MGPARSLQKLSRGMSPHSFSILSSKTTSPRPDPFAHRKRNTNGTEIPRSDFHLVFVAFVCSKIVSRWPGYIRNKCSQTELGKELGSCGAKRGG